jgi:hypothetical protein
MFFPRLIDQSVATGFRLNQPSSVIYSGRFLVKIILHQTKIILIRPNDDLFLQALFRYFAAKTRDVGDKHHA